MKMPVAMGLSPFLSPMCSTAMPTAKASARSSSSLGIVAPKEWNERVVGEFGTWYEMIFCEGRRLGFDEALGSERLGFDRSSVWFIAEMMDPRGGTTNASACRA